MPRIISINSNSSKIHSQQFHQPIKNNIVCLGHNIITLFCSNPYCIVQNTFFCSDVKCRCYQKHKYCSKFHVNVVLEEICKKINQIDQIKKEIQSIFEHFVESIIEIQKKIKGIAQKNMQYVNMTEMEAKVYQLFVLNNGKIEQFSGEKLANLMRDIQLGQNNNNKFIEDLDKFINQVEIFMKNSQYQLNKRSQKLNELIKVTLKDCNIHKNNQQKSIYKFQDFQKINNNITVKVEQSYISKYLFFQQQNQQKQQYKQYQQKQQQQQQQKYQSPQQYQQQQKQQLIHTISNISTNNRTSHENNKTIKSTDTIKIIKQQHTDNNINNINNNNIGRKLKNSLKSSYLSLMNNDNKIRIAFPQSKIIKDEMYCENLLNFFYRKVKSLQKMFTASEHNFAMEEYYKKCGDLNDTIILVQTTKNRIIGGYTPLSFTPTHQKSRYIHDPTHSSFIFSLSTNDKFNLVSYPHAIFHDTTLKSIKFGSGQLKLIDRGNQNKNNLTNLHWQAYFNQNYKDNCKDTFIRLNGNQSSKFMVKEWEVFKVEFQEKQQKINNKNNLQGKKKAKEKNKQMEVQQY